MLKIYRYSIPELSQKLIKSGLDYETTEPLRCIFDAIKHGDIAAYFEPSKNLVFAKANLFDGLNLIVPNHHNKDYIAQNILPISEVYLSACDYSISSRDPRYPDIEIKAIKSGGENVYIYQTDRDFLKRINGFKIKASDVFLSAKDADKLDRASKIITRFPQTDIYNQYLKNGKIKQLDIEKWIQSFGIKRKEAREITEKINFKYQIEKQR